MWKRKTLHAGGRVWRGQVEHFLLWPSAGEGLSWGNAQGPVARKGARAASGASLGMTLHTCHSVFLCSEIVKNHWRDVRRDAVTPVWSVKQLL